MLGKGVGAAFTAIAPKYVGTTLVHSKFKGTYNYILYTMYTMSPLRSYAVGQPAIDGAVRMKNGVSRRKIKLLSNKSLQDFCISCGGCGAAGVTAGSHAPLFSVAVGRLLHIRSEATLWRGEANNKALPPNRQHRRSFSPTTFSSV